MGQQVRKAESEARVGVTHNGLARGGQPSTHVSASHNGFSISSRRLLGAYYTPANLAEILVNWALSHVTGTVLDPSFGGCAFLMAATRMLARQGITNPGRLVFGVDVDPACTEYVRRCDGLLEEHCIVRDFLELSPNEMVGAPFKAIVGNPPYVRHHWLKGSTRHAARSAIDVSGVALPATASTWAYFLIHALSFLDEGGRLAMLVPEAILQADYAKPLRDVLAERFSRTLLIHIRERLFEGTHEPVVVVAASGYGRRGKITIDSVEQAEELEGTLARSTSQGRSSRVTVANGRTVSSATIDLLGELERHEMVLHMGDIATIQIGLVTGANNHFIRSAEELARLGIPSQVRLPVVARTRWLLGLEFTKKDHEELAAAGRRAFLVRPTLKFSGHAGVQRWIAEGVAAGVKERFKCSLRTNWFRMKLPPAPHAFATCTRLGSPLLVMNVAGYCCSNALHSVRWRDDLDISPEAVVLGFLTSLVAVWAEIHGRRYGGGVLKIEPSTLKRAPVPLVSFSRGVFDEIEGLMRAGREGEARQRADEVVLGEGLHLGATDIQRLQRARIRLASQRRPGVEGGRCG